MRSDQKGAKALVLHDIATSHPRVGHYFTVALGITGSNYALHIDPMNDGPTPPGLLIRDHVLPAFHLSISQAARDLNIARQTLHRILAGEAAMTRDMAVRLERFCGIASAFWMDCQHQYERHRLDVVMADLLARIPARCLPKDVLEQMGAHHAIR